MQKERAYVIHIFNLPVICHFSIILNNVLLVKFSRISVSLLQLHVFRRLPPRRSQRLTIRDIRMMRRAEFTSKSVKILMSPCNCCHVQRKFTCIETYLNSFFVQDYVNLLAKEDMATPAFILKKGKRRCRAVSGYGRYGSMGSERRQRDQNKFHF